jgi:hypothetical protein
MLKRNPSRVRRFPRLDGWVLINLKINTGAIRIATGIVGTSLLILVNTKIPNPRTNHTMGK